MKLSETTAFYFKASVLMAFCTMILIILFRWIQKPVEHERTVVQVMYDLNDPYTEDKVRGYLIQLHVKYPDVAIAQMKLESANGTSKIFNENNNLFGLKVPQHRPTTALGTKNNHAYYSHWRQCVLDYALFCAFTMNEENSDTQRSWLLYLGKYYAVDTSYVLKLDKILANKK